MLALALLLLSNACPMKIGIARDGSLFSARMQGWYTTTDKTILRDLRGGCYNDARPSPVTSVTVDVSREAPNQTVDRVLHSLESMGWPRNKVTLGQWTNDPLEPR